MTATDAAVLPRQQAKVAAERFGAWLRPELARRSWGPRDLARAMGAYPSMTYRWANGEQRPDAASCRLIADALGTGHDETLAAAGHRAADPAGSTAAHREAADLAAQIPPDVLAAAALPLLRALARPGPQRAVRAAASLADPDRSAGTASAEPGAGFGPWLEERLAERGWDASAFAVRAGLERATVRTWIRGDAVPDPDRIPAVAAALGVDAAAVLDAWAGHRPGPGAARDRLAAAWAAAADRLPPGFAAALVAAAAAVETGDL